MKVFSSRIAVGWFVLWCLNAGGGMKPQYGRGGWNSKWSNIPCEMSRVCIWMMLKSDRRSVRRAGGNNPERTIRCGAWGETTETKHENSKTLKNKNKRSSPQKQRETGRWEKKVISKFSRANRSLECKTNLWKQKTWEKQKKQSRAIIAAETTGDEKTGRKVNSIQG